MIDWLQYTPDQIKNEANEQGVRLLSLFSSDYKAVTGKTLCASCRGLREKINEYHQKKIEMDTKEKCDYKLKKMYEGIPLEFGSQVHVSNRNLTNKLAKQLIAKHPKGVALFEVFPEAAAEKAAAEKNK